MTTGDGGPGLSVLLSPDLIVSAAAVLAAMLVGVVSARFCGPRVGLFVAGLPLVWTALGMGRMDDVLRCAQATGSGTTAAMWALSIETLLLGVVIGAGVWVIILASPEWTRRDLSNPLTKSSAIGFGAAFVVTAAVTWLVARSDLEGQTAAACWIGAIIGAMAGRVVAQQASTVALVAAVVAVGVVGHALGAILAGDHAIAESNANTLWSLSRPLPMMYIAAALVGAPGGSAWGLSLVGRVEHEQG